MNDIISMQNHVEQFRLYLAEERKLSATTVASYTRIAGRFVQHLTREYGPLAAMEMVIAADVAAFLRSVAPGVNHSARGAWNLQLSALRGFFSFLQKEGFVTINPTNTVARVKHRSAQVDPPSLDEVLQLIEAVENHCVKAYRARNLLIIQLLFHCSLRISELVSLDLEQVRLNPNKVDGYRLVNVRRKGNKQQHIVFNDVVAEAIELYLQDRAAMGVPKNEVALIVSDRRKRISDSAVRRMIRHYAGVAGIHSATRRVSPHSLRHASATEMEKDGARPRVIQEHLGHASIQTTQRYLHTNEIEQRKVVDGIGRRFKERRNLRDLRPESGLKEVAS